MFSCVGFWASVELASVWLVDLCFGGCGHLMTVEGRMEAKSHGFPWLIQLPLAHFQIWSHFLRLACADIWLQMHWSSNVKASSVTKEQIPFSSAMYLWCSMEYIWMRPNFILIHHCIDFSNWCPPACAEWDPHSQQVPCRLLSPSN